MEWTFENSISNREKLNAFRIQLLSNFPGYKLGNMKVLENSSRVNENVLRQVFEQTPILSKSFGEKVLIQQSADNVPFFILPPTASLANPSCTPRLTLMPSQNILLEFEIQSGTAQDHINFSPINSVGLTQKEHQLVLHVDSNFDLHQQIDSMIKDFFSR